MKKQGKNHIPITGKIFQIHIVPEDIDTISFLKNGFYEWIGLVLFLTMLRTEFAIPFSLSVASMIGIILSMLYNGLCELDKSRWCHLFLLVMPILLIIPSIRKAYISIYHAAAQQLGKKGIVLWGGKNIWNGEDAIILQTIAVIGLGCIVLWLLDRIRRHPAVGSIVLFLLTMLIMLRLHESFSVLYLFLYFLWAMMLFVETARAYILCALLCMPIMLLTFIFPKQDHSEITERWMKWCYNMQEEVLPQGDLTKAGRLQRASETALKVDMEQPGYYYLKGFVGNLYENNQWISSNEYMLEIENSLLASGENLFDEMELYGQSSWNQMAVSTKEDWIDSMKVTNIDADRENIYLPYECITSVKDLEKDKKVVITTGEMLKSTGLRGVKDYHIKTSASFAGKEWKKQEKQKNPYQQYSEYVNRTCLILPKEVKDTLSEQLKKKQSAVGISDITVLKEIRYWMKKHIKYDEAPGYVPEGEDFTKWFLTDSRKGYDVQYATLAVMMFRYYGIPARYVEGYLMEGSGNITKKEAHAWPEIYREGIGWIPVEVMESYQKRMPSYVDHDRTKITSEGQAVPDVDYAETKTAEEKETTTQEETKDSSKKEAEESTKASKEANNPPPEEVKVHLMWIIILIFAASCGCLIIALLKERNLKKELLEVSANAICIRMWYRYCQWVLYEYNKKEHRKAFYEKQPEAFLENLEKADERMNKKKIRYAIAIRQKAIYRQRGITDKERQQAAMIFEYVYRTLYEKLSVKSKIKMNLGIRPKALRENFKAKE